MDIVDHILGDLSETKYCNGKITLIVHPKIVRQMKKDLTSDSSLQKMLPIMTESKFSLNKKSLTEQNYLEAMTDLFSKFDYTVSKDNSFNIFDYLPLTDKGEFDKRRHILVAAFDYMLDSHTYSGHCKTYCIMIMPSSKTTAYLEMGMFEITKADKPILQDINHPVKPNVKHTNTYLNDVDVKGGYVYLNDKDKPYLHVGISNSGGSDYYAYVAFTKKLEKACQDNNIKTYDEFIHYFYNTPGVKRPQVFSSEKPRKFVSEVRKLLDGCHVDVGEIFEYRGD